MDDQKQAEAYKDSLQEEIKHYGKLKKVSQSQEVSELFDLMLKTTVDKMIWAFTTGKDGDNIKSWDDFCKVRGEVVARLQPIQEVRGAESMEKYLLEQLSGYYKQV